MERRIVGHYIWLGVHLRYLIDCSAGWTLIGDNLVLYNIRALRMELVAAGLPVSIRSFDINFAELIASYEGKAPEYELSAADAKAINDAAVRVRETLRAESSEKVAFVTAERRYPVEKLLDKVSDLLGKGVYEKLPDVARIDLQESGRCIVFGLPTAAAFHALRATEDVLRQFYERSAKTKRVKKPYLWGSMLQDLARRKRPPSAGLLQTLDNIRFSQRNPTDHPEKVWDLDEAQDVFGLCIQAIREMVR